MFSKNEKKSSFLRPDKKQLSKIRETLLLNYWKTNDKEIKEILDQFLKHFPLLEHNYIVVPFTEETYIYQNKPFLMISNKDFCIESLQNLNEMLTKKLENKKIDFGKQILKEETILGLPYSYIDEECFIKQRKYGILEKLLYEYLKNAHVINGEIVKIGYVIPSEDFDEQLSNKGNLLIESKHGGIAFHGPYSHAIQLFLLNKAVESIKSPKLTTQGYSPIQK